MMMYHQGKPAVQEYQDAYMALVSAYKAQPWKISASHEVELQRIPPAARQWVSDTYLARADVRRMMRQLEECIVIKCSTEVGHALAQIFHTMWYRFTGVKMREFETEEKAFAFLRTRMAQKPVKRKVRFQLQE